MPAPIARRPRQPLCCRRAWPVVVCLVPREAELHLRKHPSAYHGAGHRGHAPRPLVAASPAAAMRVPSLPPPRHRTPTPIPACAAGPTNSVRPPHENAPTAAPSVLLRVEVAAAAPPAARLCAAWCSGRDARPTRDERVCSGCSGRDRSLVARTVARGPRMPPKEQRRRCVVSAREGQASLHVEDGRTTPRGSQKDTGDACGPALGGSVLEQACCRHFCRGGI